MLWLENGAKFLQLRSLTSEEDLIIIKYYKLLEDMTLKEVRKLLDIEDISWKELEFFSIMLSSTTEWISFIKENINFFNLHFLLNKKSWVKLVNWVISNKTCTKLKEIRLKNIIWLQLQNSQFQPCTDINGWKRKISPKDMEEFHHVSENKLELMEKIHGEFSEFISLKKLNNFTLQLLINHGKCSKRWFQSQKNSISHWDCLIEWYQLSQVLLMMLQQRNMILKLGSLAMMTIES